LKQFKKNKDNFFVCEECGQICKIKSGLSFHINKKHTGLKNYYDKYLREKDESLCKICNKETLFLNLKVGYHRCCKEHRCEWREMNKRKNNKEKYGIDNVFQLKDVQIRGLKKSRETCLKRYGVKSPSQVKEIYEKTQKSGFKAKQFNNTNIYYRGSYELDFLQKYYENYIDIQNGPRIKYIFEEKEHYYFPDFYIPSLNLIIEIKSLWIMKKQNEKIIKEKEKAAIANGFKYLMIVDKNYTHCNL
jgi:hypothetical protein